MNNDQVHMLNFNLNAEEDKAVRDAMHNVMLVAVRGVIGVCPHMPYTKVMALMCHSLGRVLCELYIGDAITVHKFRKTCRDVFETTMKGMPVITPQAAPDPEKTETAAVG